MATTGTTGTTDTTETVRFTVAYNVADLTGSSALEDLMLHVDVEVTGPAEVTVHGVTTEQRLPAWVDLAALEAAVVRDVSEHPDEVAVRAVDVDGVLTSLAQYEALYRLWPQARTIHGEPVEIDELRAAGMR